MLVNLFIATTIEVAIIIRLKSNSNNQKLPRSPIRLTSWILASYSKKAQYIVLFYFNEPQSFVQNADQMKLKLSTRAMSTSVQFAAGANAKFAMQDLQPMSELKSPE